MHRYRITRDITLKTVARKRYSIAPEHADSPNQHHQITEIATRTCSANSPFDGPTPRIRRIRASHTVRTCSLYKGCRCVAGLGNRRIKIADTRGEQDVSRSETRPTRRNARHGAHATHLQRPAIFMLAASPALSRAACAGSAPPTPACPYIEISCRSTANSRIAAVRSAGVARSRCVCKY